MGDAVFFNGVLLTQDAAAPRAGAMAVAGGRITAVGAESDVLAAAPAAARRVDLAGRTVVPGFHDAHAHLWKIGDLLARSLDLRRVASLAELTARLREAHARLPPGAWLLGRGWNELFLREGRGPERAELDAAAPGRPVFLVRTCAHVAVASSAALRLAGIRADSEPPAGGVIEREAGGEPSGRLAEAALGLVQRAIGEPSRDEYETMLDAASRHQLALGITSTSDAGVTPALLGCYLHLDARGALRQRVNAMALAFGHGGERLPPPGRHLSARLRVDTVKLFADGGLSGATAALSEPYRHQPSRGVLRMAAGEIEACARAAAAAGLRVAVHAIGDRAIETALEGLSAAGPLPQPPRLEHCGLPDDGQLRRLARLGAPVAPQAIFLPALGENFRRYLSDALLERAYPLRAMLDAGLTVALSSDAPVVEDDSPLSGIQAAVLRRDGAGEVLAPGQAITAAEALYAYTAGAARASGDFADRGRLATGCWADFAVLGENPLDVDPEALREIRVERTYVGGEPAFEA